MPNVMCIRGIYVFFREKNSSDLTKQQTKVPMHDPYSLKFPGKRIEKGVSSSKTDYVNSHCADTAVPL